MIIGSLLLGAFMSLGEERAIVSGGKRVPVRADTFTKLLIHTGREGKPDRTDKEQIADAIGVMKGSHCAIQAIAGVLEKPGEVAAITFGETDDENGVYDFRIKTIIINKSKTYFRDPENLAKGLYHEGLHHVEIGLGLRQPGEGMHYHDSARIPVILKALLGKDSPCLKQVGTDAFLVNANGLPFEPDYGRAVEPVVYIRGMPVPRSVIYGVPASSLPAPDLNKALQGDAPMQDLPKFKKAPQNEEPAPARIEDKR